MSKIFFPEQGDKIVLEAIDRVTLSHNLKEIDDLSELDPSKESNFTDAILEEDEGQTLLHILALINYVSRVEELMLTYLQGKGIKFIKVGFKIVLQSVLEF